MLSDTTRQVCLDALQFWRSTLDFDEEKMYVDAALADLKALPPAQPLDMPDRPGWWAFEGSEWTQGKVVCSKAEADGWHDGEWDEGDEPNGFYFRYEDVPGEKFEAVLKLRWVHKGEAINERRRSGSHSGEPVLGFLSPKYRWDYAAHSVETLTGKWYRLTMPWEER